MNRFEWIEAHTADEASVMTTATVASAMIAQPGQQPDGEAAVIKAGGIDLLDLMKEGLIAPRRVVNLRGAAGLDAITTERDGTLRIGALVTLAQLSEHVIIRERYTALANATEKSASPQIRHVGTLGGNLLQRPRCWYFRSSQYHCIRKGGEACFAFSGENQYHAIFDHQNCAIVHPSTAATALVAMEARVELVTNRGEKREMRLEDFFLLPKIDIHRENHLKAGEILTAVLLPPVSARVRSIHLKQGEKDSFDWPVADVAVLLELSADGICERASIVLGAAAPVPHRAREAEAAVVGKPISEQTARTAGRAALAGAEPLSKNAYKLPIFEALVRRALQYSGIRFEQERKMASQNPNQLGTNCPGGSLTLGGDTTVNRLGFGAMHLCGPGVWGEPLDRPGAKRVLMRGYHRHQPPGRSSTRAARAAAGGRAEPQRRFAVSPRSASLTTSLSDKTKQVRLGRQQSLEHRAVRSTTELPRPIGRRR